jgi:hypothetical protein
MEIFQLMHQFYVEEKFSDLKIVSGLDKEQVLCHSLVIISAVPGLKDVLKDHLDSLEESTTLVFPEIPSLLLKEVVSDIYDSLVQVRLLKTSNRNFLGTLLLSSF